MSCSLSALNGDAWPLPSGGALARIQQFLLGQLVDFSGRAGLFADARASAPNQFSAGSIVDVGVVAADQAGVPAQNALLEVNTAVDLSDLRSALDGDQQAYARLVARYQAAIGGQMWRFTREPAVYEELVHDVFVEAYFSLSKYRGDAPLVHWLRKIATRVGFRYWKQRARRRVEQSLTAAQVAMLADPRDVAPIVADASEKVYLLLGQLPPRDRLVLTLLYWDGCSVAEAADLTGWSQTMVKVQAFRARRKMKKLLDG